MDLEIPNSIVVSEHKSIGQRSLAKFRSIVILFFPELPIKFNSNFLRLIVFLFICSFLPPSYAQTIDNASSWDNTNFTGTWGVPNTATYGQTFTAPAGAGYLNTFQVYLKNFSGSQVNYQAYLYSWDGAHATGLAIFAGAVSQAPNSPSSFTPVLINTGSAPVTAGSNYVFFLTTSDVTNPSNGDYFWGENQIVNSYLGGKFVYLNNGPASFNDIYTGIWGDGCFMSDCFSLAFIANFAPSSLNISSLTVDVSQASNTSTSTNTAANLSGAVTVNVANGSAAYLPNRKMTIVSSTGLSGTFSGVTTSQNLSFLTPTLSYDANNVYLAYSLTPFSTVAKNTNQRNVGNALTFAALSPVNGLSAPILNSLYYGNYENAQAVMDTVGGSGLAGVQSAAMQVGEMTSSSVSDQIAFWRSG
ncbi:MAG: hypothetical protein EB015_13365, partial [Methylocystaceae bacterium]|nr:hypothetical protein [Methylocystaceae bacterium]